MSTTAKNAAPQPAAAKQHAPPTQHQQQLARVLKEIAFSLERGEVKMTNVIVHRGTVKVQPDAFTVDRDTDKRAIGIVLRYSTEGDIDHALRHIVNEAAMT